MQRSFSPPDRALGPREQAMISAAARVGLSDESGVIRKALELERLLAMKLTGGGGFSDTCRNLLCLDLAADALGQSVDRATVIKQSGLKKLSYQNSRSTAERLLEMRQIQTAASVCLKLQCVGSQHLAERILATFQRTQEVDLSNPQYTCMAVFQACRLAKVKVSKSKLITLSGLKTTQWAKLEAVWTKFVDQHFADEKGKKAAAEPLVVKCINDVEMAEDTTRTEKHKELEPYEVWRRRILEVSYRELREIQQKEQPTPRKSPRKRETPTKAATPNKLPLDRSRGVRLLF